MLAGEEDVLDGAARARTCLHCSTAWHSCCSCGRSLHGTTQRVQGRGRRGWRGAPQDGVLLSTHSCTQPCSSVPPALNQQQARGWGTERTSRAHKTHATTKTRRTVAACAAAWRSPAGWPAVQGAQSAAVRVRPRLRAQPPLQRHTAPSTVQRSMRTPVWPKRWENSFSKVWAIVLSATALRSSAVSRSVAVVCRSLLNATRWWLCAMLLLMGVLPLLLGPWQRTRRCVGCRSAKLGTSSCAERGMQCSRRTAACCGGCGGNFNGACGGPRAFLALPGAHGTPRRLLCRPTRNRFEPCDRHGV
jgi:hypothetical protein